MIAAARRRLGQFEFTALLAAAMSMAALGIDLLLPAFGDIRDGLGLPADSTAVAGLITAYFLGLALGQPFYGPASDALGRKRVLYAGFGVYAVGALLTAVAPTLPLLLAGRFIWGLGAAGPRVIVIAIVRDRYEGEQMSRAMSLIMSVFMVVPVFAPTLGALGVSLVSWRWLFVACAVAVGLLSIWTTRLSETLPPERRVPLRFDRLLGAARQVVRNRQTVGYTLAMTLMYGGFTSYLASSELIFSDTFDAADSFPFWFGALAVVMAGGMLLNARVVERVGGRRLSHRTLLVYLAAAGALVIGSVAYDGRPPLPLFLASMAVLLGGHAIIIPNFNTLAMQPMGAVAGTASALTGAVQTALGALLGATIDQQFDGGIMPLSVSLLVLGVGAAAAVMWADGAPLVLRRAPDPQPAVPTAA